MIRWYVILICPLFFIHADRVDVISDWSITDIQIDWDNQEYFGCKIVQHWDFNRYVMHREYETAKKIICMNDIASEKLLPLVSKEKIVMFFWEPLSFSHSYATQFSRVYTHNDRLVDGVQYFKLFYPFAVAMTDPIPSFYEKKLATLITFHWTSEREDVVRFYNQKPSGEFEFYGYNPGDFQNNPMYRGKIPGYHSGPEKNEVLKQYRFCYCYENSQIPGYITEKIFACFKAGCVPIYFGAPNILDYIPKNCLIDFRSFNSLESIYQYIKSMPEEEYNYYLQNIREFIASEKGQIFSPKEFENFLRDVIYN